MKHLKNLLASIAVLFCLVTSGLSQESFGYSASAEKIFAGAIQQFREGDFISALGSFEILLNREPAHQRTTAAYIMAGKSLQNLKKYRESSMLLTDFLKRFPDSNYRDEAHYTLAIDYMMLQQDEEAVRHLIDVIESTSKRNLSTNAVVLFETIADERLEDYILQELQRRSKTEPVKDLLSLKIAERYIASGVPNRAGALLDEMLNRVPKSKYETKARILKEKITANVNLKVGVLLPFMKTSAPNSIKTISEEILDGITIATDQYRITHAIIGAVTLEIRDTERESDVAVDALKDLARKEEIVAVIGPLFSNIAKACAPVAERAGLPLITPTAAADGIAALSSHLFQASPDYQTRGKAMARYAVRELGFKKLAILSTTEPIGKALAESFSREAERLGARIVVTDFYSKGASDLSDQFYNIRNAGLAMNGKHASVRNLEIPVDAIQGLFIPISDADDIGILASQIKYFNIETQILGSNEWYDMQQLESNKQYLKGMSFISDTYLDKNDSRYLDFVKSFSAQMNKAPTKYTLRGYNLMKLLLDKIDRGAVTREKLAGALGSTKNYPGIGSRISFSRNRVNQELQILQFINNEVRKVTEISVN
jgi:ABC-type branched-subunit amino acid transport system substrate-binding protein